MYKRQDYILPKTGQDNKICDSYITTIYRDKTGCIWIGSKNGLYLYDKKKHSLKVFRRETNKTVSLSENYIYSIYETGAGILWFGTYATGLNKFDPGQPRFRNYQKDINLSKSKSENLISVSYTHLTLPTTPYV